MKIKKKIVILGTSYIMMLMLMLVLPIFSMPDYSMIKNTVSELGAQDAPNAWLMNFTLIFLALSALVAGWGFYTNYQFQRIFLLIFSISLTLSAFFNPAPVDFQTGFDINEEAWHSYLICTAGLSFIMLCFSTSVALENPVPRLISILIGLSAIVLSILIAEADSTAGIWDRLLFIISFGWMIWSFNLGSVKTASNA